MIADWEQVRSGPFYYWWNVTTGETRWEKPREAPGTGNTWRELDAASGYRATRRSHASKLSAIEEVDTPLLSPHPQGSLAGDEQRASRQLMRENTIFGSSSLATGEEEEAPDIEFADIYAEAMAETYSDELVVGLGDGMPSVGDADTAGEADMVAWPEASPAGDAGRLSSGWKQIPQEQQSPLLAFAAELTGTPPQQAAGVGLLAEPSSADLTALEAMREQMRPELSDAILDALAEAKHPLAAAFDPSRVTSRDSLKAAEDTFASAFDPAFDEAWEQVTTAGALDWLSAWGPSKRRGLQPLRCCSLTLPRSPATSCLSTLSQPTRHTTR